ncbi:MAG: TIGR04219 family outer membrane beta-barrel protein [Cocleimonas sp.]
MNIRKQYLTALFCIMIMPNLQADTLLGADIEIGLWSPSYDAGNASKNVTGKSQSVFVSATIEHPVPLLPNLKVSISKVDSSAYDYTKIDYTGYYEILDNDMVSIDVGLGVTDFQDGHYLGLPFSEILPHVYFDAEVSFPLTNLTGYTDIHFLSVEGNSMTDAIVGLRYDFELIAVDLGVKAGYRIQRFDVEDFDQLSFDVETKGAFVGLQADF